MKNFKLLAMVLCVASFNLRGDDMVRKLMNLNFDMGKEYWDMPDEFKIVRNAGRNGTNALYIKRPSTDPAAGAPRSASRIVRFEHGKNYKIGAWIKANITGRGKYRTAASFTLHFYDKNGKNVHNIFPIGVMETSDWTYVEKVFTMYPGSDYCKICLDLFHHYAGEVWFDSLQIDEHDKNCVYAIAPAPLVLDPARPEVLAGALNTCNHLPEDVRIRGSLLSLTGGRLAQVTGKVEKGMTKLTFPPQKEGKYQLKLELLDVAEKPLDSTVLTIRIGSKAPVAGIGLDRILRVNGKKFMVLGMYVGQCPDDELAMLQQAGFNTVMPYGSLSLNKNYRFDGKGRETPRDRYTGDRNNTAESVREVLDNIHKRDMKIIFNLANVYDICLKPFNLEQWQGASGTDAITAKVVASFKDHPALLAWYVCDEMPASMRDLIRRRREEILELDGGHPTWMVSMHFTELYNFLNTADIMGTDTYPLKGRDSDLNPLEFAGSAARRLNMPHFLVGQCFSWAYYEPVEKLGDIETWNRYRTPTEKEMRSMCLSYAIDGATGFLYYYFPGVTNPNIPIAGYREKMLAALKNVNSALKKIEDFILSGNEIKIITPEIAKGRVRVGEFTDEKGRRCVVVVGCALGNRAEFALTGEFESLFGLCKNDRGRWQFSSDGIDSDILIEKKKP